MWMTMEDRKRNRMIPYLKFIHILDLLDVGLDIVTVIEILDMRHTLEPL